ncbi:hypothetical protein DFH08DRAFT_827076 [Mycena albidolilacea]|uniref:Uncharacterized protein n=1 Tax=Mycena albidolilacea TaxID=1033008 RepID=A0AAD6YZ91_9AGAR|nr:hypothetical protein DFH08DRAFT_827076 [Mycena albidolilacea]
MTALESWVLARGFTRNYIEGHKQSTSKSKVTKKVVPDPGPQGVHEFSLPRNTAYTHRAPTDHTPIHLHIATNIHARPIFVDDAPLGQPYIHNTVQNIAIPPIPVHAFQAGS